MHFILTIIKELSDFFLGEDPNHKIWIIIGIIIILLLSANCYFWAVALGFI